MHICAQHMENEYAKPTGDHSRPCVLTKKRAQPSVDNRRHTTGHFSGLHSDTYLETHGCDGERRRPEGDEVHWQRDGAQHGAAQHLRAHQHAPSPQRCIRTAVHRRRHSPFQVLDASAIEGIRGLAGDSSFIYSCIQIYKALTPPAPPAYRGATEGPGPPSYVGSSEERPCPYLGLCAPPSAPAGAGAAAGGLGAPPSR